MKNRGISPTSNDKGHIPAPPMHNLSHSMLYMLVPMHAVLPVQAVSRVLRLPWSTLLCKPGSPYTSPVTPAHPHGDTGDNYNMYVYCMTAVGLGTLLHGFSYVRVIATWHMQTILSSSVTSYVHTRTHSEVAKRIRNVPCRYVLLGAWRLA